MSEYLHKSHNGSVLIYHFVCPAKYRRVVFSETIDCKLKETCEEISKRYESHFLEVGTDRDHVPFLVQSVPRYSPKKIVPTVKSLPAREILAACPEVKKKLGGGELCSEGYFISTVGQHGNEEVIKKYLQNPGTDSDYQHLHQRATVGRQATHPILIPRSLLRGSSFPGFRCLR